MIEERIKELGLDLPAAPKAVGSYQPCVRSGNMLYVSGQLPMKDGQLLAKGPVGEACTPEEAKQAARQCVMNILAVAKQAAVSLDNVYRIVQLQGMVHTPFADASNCVPTMNAASDLLFEIFGDKGLHSRAAVGVAALPLGAAVEVLAIIELA